MAEKSTKITKKVIAAKTPVKGEKEEVKEESAKAEKKRGCFFCKGKVDPTYTDVATLRKFVSDRGKIVPKIRTAVCSKHQRRVTRQIKYARHLALLPFTPSV